MYIIILNRLQDVHSFTFKAANHMIKIKIKTKSAKEPPPCMSSKPSTNAACFNLKQHFLQDLEKKIVGNEEDDQLIQALKEKLQQGLCPVPD